MPEAAPDDVLDGQPVAARPQVGRPRLEVTAQDVLHASVGGLYVVQAAGAPQVGLLAATLVLFLPALTFAMVTGLWLLRMLADIAGLARR